VHGFERLPHAQAAVRVRRWDDQAKDPGLPTPTFEHFRQLLSRLTARQVISASSTQRNRVSGA
jgi:predicted HD phosphohydrolase